MANKNTLRYVKTDFKSSKDALLQRVRSRYPRLWNDFLSNSFGIVLVDIVAWVTATLSFLINRQASENFISTMTLRESAIRIGTLTGYKLRSKIPSVISVEATISSVESSDVTIPKGTILRTSDSSAIPFEILEEIIIEAGNLTPETLILTINAAQTGANIVNSFVSVINGSVNADIVDTSIDMTQFVEQGQTFQQVGDESTAGIISTVEAAPSAISNNRLVLAVAWTGSTGIISAEIVDKRVVLVQGQTVNEQFVSPGVDTPNFSIKLGNTPAIDLSTELTVNGESWSEITSKVSFSPDSKVYEVKTLTSGDTIVVFGDGSFGSLITTDATISITYRTGGGTSGNVGLNSISTSVTGTVSSLNSPVTVTITNTSSTGVGGRDAETLEEARISIPATTRANARAVTLSDYQVISQSFVDSTFGSVAFARPVIRTENSLLEGNIVTIYAWTTGPGGGLANLSSPLKRSFKDFMQTVAVGTDFVIVADGTQQPAPISLRFKTLEGSGVTDTTLAVQATLSSFINRLFPGQTVIYSDLVRELDSTDGVDNLDMSTPITDLIPSSSTELFTVPSSDNIYSLDRNGSGSPVASEVDGGNISLYTAQMPVFPVQSWSVKLFLGLEELTVTPGIKPGFAQLYGSNLSINSEKDSDGFLVYGSTINLLTGAVQLWLKGVPGDLTLKLDTVKGYTTDRPVAVYAGYSGINTLSKRREIRSALRAWSNGLPIGGDVYGSEVSGIAVSKSSITSVIEAVTGVDGVNRVALETPGNAETRVTALDTELLLLGNIVLNNSAD